MEGTDSTEQDEASVASALEHSHILATDKQAGIATANGKRSSASGIEIPAAHTGHQASNSGHEEPSGKATEPRTGPPEGGGGGSANATTQEAPPELVDGAELPITSAESGADEPTQGISEPDVVICEEGRCGGDEAQTSNTGKNDTHSNSEQGLGAEVKVEEVASGATESETDETKGNSQELPGELPADLYAANRGLDEEGAESEVEGRGERNEDDRSTDELPLQGQAVAPGVVVEGSEDVCAEVLVEEGVSGATALAVVPGEEVSMEPAAPTTVEATRGDSLGVAAELRVPEAAGNGDHPGTDASEAAPAPATVDVDVSDGKEDAEATNMVASSKDSQLQQLPSGSLLADSPLPDVKFDPPVVEERLSPGGDPSDVHGAGNDDAHDAESGSVEISRDENSSGSAGVDPNACSTTAVGVADTEQAKSSEVVGGMTPDASMADAVDDVFESASAVCPAASETGDVETATIGPATVASPLGTGEETGEDLGYSLSAGSDGASRTAGKEEPAVGGLLEPEDLGEDDQPKANQVEEGAEIGPEEGSSTTNQEEVAEVGPTQNEDAADAGETRRDGPCAPQLAPVVDAESGGKDGKIAEEAGTGGDIKEEGENEDATEAGELRGGLREVPAEINETQTAKEGGDDDDCFEAFDEMSSSVGEGLEGAGSGGGGGAMSSSIDGPGTSISLGDESIGGGSGGGEVGGGIGDGSATEAEAGKPAIPTGLVGGPPLSPSLDIGGG